MRKNDEVDKIDKISKICYYIMFILGLCPGEDTVRFIPTNIPCSLSRRKDHIMLTKIAQGFIVLAFAIIAGYAFAGCYGGQRYQGYGSNYGGSQMYGNTPMQGSQMLRTAGLPVGALASAPSGQVMYRAPLRNVYAGTDADPRMAQVAFANDALVAADYGLATEGQATNTAQPVLPPVVMNGAPVQATQGGLSPVNAAAIQARLDSQAEAIVQLNRRRHR